MWCTESSRYLHSLLSAFEAVHRVGPWPIFWKCFKNVYSVSFLIFIFIIQQLFYCQVMNFSDISVIVICYLSFSCLILGIICKRGLYRVQYENLNGYLWKIIFAVRRLYPFTNNVNFLYQLFFWFPCHAWSAQLLMLWNSCIILNRIECSTEWPWNYVWSPCLSSDGSLGPLAWKNKTKIKQHSQVSCQTCQVSQFSWKGTVVVVGLLFYI
jgi:hypothetical protein